MIIESKITEKFMIYQDTNKFCFGTDAVLLSYFANIKKKDIVVDFCSGTGAVGFMCYLKYSQKHTFLVDIDNDILELSKKTAEYNNISDKFSFICSDINIRKQQAASTSCVIQSAITEKCSELNGNSYGIKNESIDYITVNPPYFKENSGKINKNNHLIFARHSLNFSLDELFLKSYKILKVGGKISLVHRAEYLAEVIFQMKKNKIEPKRLQLVQSYKNKPANLILIEGVKNGGIDFKCMAPLILYDENGETAFFKNIQTMKG